MLYISADVLKYLHLTLLQRKFGVKLSSVKLTVMNMLHIHPGLLFSSSAGNVEG